MGRIYRSAQGKPVDVDMLRLKNEEIIAIGNMKVNARGDELGPGGQVVKTRNEAMDEYYASNAIYTQESAAHNEQHMHDAPATADTFADLDPEIAAQDAEMPAQPQLRGSLADAVAKTAKVVEPKILTNKKPISRI